MKKLVTIIGARPQIIKASALSRAMAKFPEQLQEVIIHTGQHYDDALSGAFFRELGVPRPVLNLGIGSGTHAEQTAGMLPGLEDFLLKEKPDGVILYGDTNSTLAGALVASKLYIPIIHVEAGLRSGDMGMPEEVNRICTDKVSTLLFAPTPSALKNLEKEGIPLTQDPPLNPDKPLAIHSGDVMLDNQHFYLGQLEGLELPSELAGLGNSFILSTFHREKNTHDPNRLEGICQGLISLAEESTDIVIPLHPRTRKAFIDHGMQRSLDRLENHPHIRVTKPLSYLHLLSLLEKAQMVATDSGGLQKEAYFLAKPSILFREETEWTEIVDAGYADCAGADPLAIKQAYIRLRDLNAPMDSAIFGKGNAAERICRYILEYL